MSREVEERVAALGLDALETALARVPSVLGELFTGRASISEVHYRFRYGDDADPTWRVRRVHAVEALSEPYEAELELVANSTSVDLDSMLGCTCSLDLVRGSSVRSLRGIILRLDIAEASLEQTTIRVWVAPAFSTLAHRVNSRIFQDKTVPEIVTMVLDEHLKRFRRSHRLELTRQYSRREYCVQYAETDLAFVQRLLEEEGIVFRFEHEEEAECVVLTDTNASFERVEGWENRPVPLIASHYDRAEEESIQKLESRASVGTTSFVVRDYDWTRPSLNVTYEERAESASGHTREAFAFGEELVLGGYSESEHHYTDDDGTEQARLRAEHGRVASAGASGSGIVTTFAAGRTFEVVGHGRRELEGRYLLTRLEHVGFVPRELGPDAHGADEPQYENRFECIPLDVPYRPERRTPKPRVHGTQSARVVGPSGEEIHVDHHGRVRVQFHWDREGERNQHSSCWVRVMQPWAGQGFGALFLPRIGMEVVVDFQHGNPDRPLVIGCVYNGENATPCDLPRSKTQTTLRTATSPARGNNTCGYNELRFEDAAGAEEIYIHAERDFIETVLHNHTTTVHADQTNTVRGNQTESVEGTQSLSVDETRTKTIARDETSTVRGNRSETVEGSDTLHVVRDRTKSIDASEHSVIGSERTTTVVSRDITVVGRSGSASAPGGAVRYTEVIGKDVLFASQEHYTTVGDKIELKQGSSTMTMNAHHIAIVAASGGHVLLEHASGRIRLERATGAVKVESGSEIELHCGGCVVGMKDGKVRIVAPSELSLTVGSSTIKLDASGITSSGAQLTSTATGTHEIKGSIVKIN